MRSCALGHRPSIPSPRAEPREKQLVSGPGSGQAGLLTKGRCVSPILDNWFRFLWSLLLAAIVINVAVALIKPAVPFLIAIAAIVGIFQIVRWWRERW